jgi:hypothetical protein
MTGLPRYRAKSDLVQPAIVKALRDMGCLVINIRKPVDLLIQFPGSKLQVIADAKTPRKQGGKDKLTDSQQALIAAGWEVWILRDVQDAVNLVNTVRRQAAA